MLLAGPVEISFGHLRVLFEAGYLKSICLLTEPTGAALPPDTALAYIAKYPSYIYIYFLAL